MEGDVWSGQFNYLLPSYPGLWSILELVKLYHWKLALWSGSGHQRRITPKLMTSFMNRDKKSERAHLP